MRPDIRVRRWNNQLKTLVLLGGLTALLVGVGGTVAPGSMWLFLALALAMNVGGYWFSDRILLRMHGAREVSEADAPRLHATVRELAMRARIPMPRVFVIEDEHANAFATGRSPRHGAVAVTTGILRLLDAGELRGVLAHELAHIRNRDTLVSTLAAAVAGAVTYLAHALSFGLFAGRANDGEEEGSMAGGLLVALVAPLAATVVQLAISRSREFLADDDGAHIAGDPLALASALGRLEHGAALVPGAVQPAAASLFIVNPFAGAGRLAGLFSTHPSTEERIARLHALARSGLRPAA